MKGGTRQGQGDGRSLGIEQLPSSQLPVLNAGLNQENVITLPAGPPTFSPSFLVLFPLLCFRVPEIQPSRTFDVPLVVLPIPLINYNPPPLPRVCGQRGAGCT